MHSSRMRTVRNSSRLGWGYAPEGSASRGGSAPGVGSASGGGLLLGGSAPGGVVSQNALRQTPPPRGQNDRHV